VDGGSAARWLLIGNSRWHWAGLQDGELITWDAAPAVAPGPVVHAWAAVGPVPPGADLPQERRLRLADVPLGEAPSWLGIDRALEESQSRMPAAGKRQEADRSIGVGETH
jgi:type III pantothenate kinase